MIPDTLTLETASNYLIGDERLVNQVLGLDLEGCRIALRSNSEALLEKLRVYFHHVLSQKDDRNFDIEILAIERPAFAPELDYIDWKREPGKKGRKDSYIDFPNGRLVRKVRTGMVFLQSRTQHIAAGPCLDYDNQVINYINAQYMNRLQQQGWLICHAAGLVHDGRALGLAGFSGGGKSTLMLHLLEQDDIHYLTNDRLFITRDKEDTLARGIPKLPRVNPGTIVHNPSLYALIPEAEREKLLSLPQQELWELEDKYDVMIDSVYGTGRIAGTAPLEHFLVLNWQRDLSSPPALQEVDLDQRRDLLGAIMKSPGPFYQFADGRFYQDTMELDEAAYLQELRDVSIHEVTGGIDFDRLKQLCLGSLF